MNNWESATDEQRKALIYESDKSYDFMGKLIPVWKFMGIAVCIGFIAYGSFTGLSFILNTTSPNMIIAAAKLFIPVFAGLFALYFMTFKLPKVFGDMQSDFNNAMETNNVLITVAYLSSKHMKASHNDHDRTRYYIKTMLDGVEQTIRVDSEFYNMINYNEWFYVIDTGMDDEYRFLCRDRYFFERMISEMSSSN